MGVWGQMDSADDGAVTGTNNGEGAGVYGSTGTAPGGPSPSDTYFAWFVLG